MDNYPNACLEAQSALVPVIGTYGSSIDEMIEDGATGFLAENGSAASVQRTIERFLAQSDAERMQMRERLSALVKSRSEADPVGELIDLYRRTIRSFNERAR